MGMHGKYECGRTCAQVMVAAITAIYLFVWAVYHFVCVPQVAEAIFFNLFFVLALWSYYKSAFTDPGSSASPEWQEWANANIGSIEACKSEPSDDTVPGNRYRGWQVGELTKCSYCKSVRPERAHHCKQCGVCILRMDHHCPWVANCIGYRNHKYFILLLWWSFLACMMFIFTCNQPTSLQALLGLLKAGDQTDENKDVVALIALIISLVFGAVTGGVFISSVSMAVTNTTAVENLYFGDNPYTYPSSFDNLRTIFGSLDLWALLPVEPADTEMRGCGTSFPTPAKAAAAAAISANSANKETKSGYGTV